MPGARAVLIGCGELGSRHLQALAAVPDLEAIDIVDPRPEALAVGQRRLAEVPGGARITARWHQAIEPSLRGPDVCVVATQAQGRCGLVRQLGQTLACRRFLIEKIVGQSIDEIEALDAWAQTEGVGVWVNCKTRAYPIHERIKAALDPSEPVILSAVGGNHGLANNGVHTADLFAFYDGSDAIDPVAAQVDPMLHPSRRGADIFDLSGTVQGATARGGHLTISYARDHAHSELLTIGTRTYRAQVDHFLRWAVESRAGGPWQPVPFEGNLLVSAMTTTFAGDLLRTGDCDLPTLRETLPAHRFILGLLAPHFERLLQRELDACPVT